MTVAWTDIRDLPSGEFASLTQPVVESYIAEALRELDAAVFGERLDDATKYLAAHLLSLSRSGSVGPSGPMIAEHVGPVGRTYAVPMDGSSKSTLSTTAYGRRYADIRRQVAGGPWVM